MRPGRGFDGSQGQDFGEFLRRELHAAGTRSSRAPTAWTRSARRSGPGRPTPAGGTGMAIWGAIAAFGTQLSRNLGSRVRRLLPAGQRAQRRRQTAQGLARGDAPAGLRHWPGRVPHRGGPGRRAFYSQRYRPLRLESQLGHHRHSRFVRHGVDGRPFRCSSVNRLRAFVGQHRRPRPERQSDPLLVDLQARGGDADRVWLVRQGQLAGPGRRDHQPGRVIKRGRQQRLREPGAPVLPTARAPATRRRPARAPATRRRPARAPATRRPPARATRRAHPGKPPRPRPGADPPLHDPGAEPDRCPRRPRAGPRPRPRRRATATSTATSTPATNFKSLPKVSASSLDNSKSAPATSPADSSSAPSSSTVAHPGRGLVVRYARAHGHAVVLKAGFLGARAARELIAPRLHQRAERLSRTAAATGPAVEVRRTVGPRLAGIAPAVRKAALSSSVIPPSGPTITTRSPDSGRLR